MEAEILRYRTQIKRACLELGESGGTFDYTDVRKVLGGDLCRILDDQIYHVMRSARYLEIAEKGDKNHPTRYRLVEVFLSMSSQEVGDERV